MKIFNTVLHLMKLITDEELYIIYCYNPIFMLLSSKREKDYTIEEIIEVMCILTEYLDNKIAYLFKLL